MGSSTQMDRRTRIGVIIVMLILGALVVMATDFVFGLFGGPSPSATPSGASPAGAAGANVWNLDGGMNAWTASGRQLVQKNR